MEDPKTNMLSLLQLHLEESRAQLLEIKNEVLDIKTNLTGSLDGHPGIYARITTLEKDLGRIAELQEKQINAIEKTISLNKTEIERSILEFANTTRQQIAKDLAEVKSGIESTLTQKELQKIEENQKWFKRTVFGALLALIIGTLSTLGIYATKEFISHEINEKNHPVQAVNPKP